MLLAALLVGAPMATPDVYDELNAHSNIVNGDFEVGLPMTVTTTMFPLDIVMQATGSLSEGLTDHRAKVAAPGWSFRIFTGQGLPASSIWWDGSGGTPGNLVHEELPGGSLMILYDAADTGHETAVLTQSLGSDPHFGFVTGPTSLFVDAYSSHNPIALRAAVYTVQDPGMGAMLISEPVLVDSSTYETYELVLPTESRHTVTEVFLFLQNAATVRMNDQSTLAFPDADSSGGALIHLDNVRFETSRFTAAATPSGGYIQGYTDFVCRVLGDCGGVQHPGIVHVDPEGLRSDNPLAKMVYITPYPHDQ